MKKENRFIYIIIVILLTGVALTALNYIRNRQKATKDFTNSSPAPNEQPGTLGTGVTTNPEDKPGEFGSFSAMTLTGEAFTSENLKGHKVNLINIWATYCGPCISEMPDLEKVSKHYGDEVQIIGICLDISDQKGNTDSELLELAINITDNVTKVTYTNLIPPAELIGGVLGDIYAVPTTNITDENGKVLESFMGSRKESDFISIIDKYLS